MVGTLSLYIILPVHKYGRPVSQSDGSFLRREMNIAIFKIMSDRTGNFFFKPSSSNESVIDKKATSLSFITKVSYTEVPYMSQLGVVSQDI